MELAEMFDYLRLFFLRNYDRHSDTHVESGEHFRIRDISFFLDETEYRKDPDPASVDLRSQTVRDDTAKVAGDSAAGDVRHAGDPVLAKQAFEYRGVGSVGLYDLFNKRVAVDLLEFDLRHLIEEHTYQGITICVKSVRRKCEYSIAFFDRGSVDDLLSFTDTCDTRCENIYAGIYNRRLDGSFTADE